MQNHNFKFNVHINFLIIVIVREAAKKISLNGRTIKRKGGGEVKGRDIKEKITFYGTFFSQHSNFPTAIVLEGGG